MAPPSSSNPPPSSSPSLPLSRSHLFTPIQEGNESEETDDQLNRYNSLTATATATTTPSGTSCSSITHQTTPFHNPSKKTTTKSRRSEKVFSGDRTVSCTDCRPTHREKIIVPFDNNITKNTHTSHPPSTPNNLFKTFLAGISRRSPRTPVTETSSPAPENEERLRVVVAELSRKLVQATRRRDEAISESSKLKYSMSELEKKLNRLEVYCNNLKNGLESCGFNHQLQSRSPARNSPLVNFGYVRIENHDMVIKDFLVSVSEARSSIRFLSKSLTSQLKLMGIKVFERLSTLLLRSYDIKLSSSSNPKSLQFYLEALLNNAFFLDFDSVGFERSSTNQVLNPIERSESNYTDFSSLKDLAWEEVLNKGTKHFSEAFSRFCDRKMSEIVAMLGWNRAWPEQLLQAFFGASKSVWLVHLLANSVHPALTIFRVDKGVRFDPVYMEDMGGDKAKKLLPSMVRIMVTPGFYVYDNVVKCKVICRYYDNDYNVLHANGGSNYNSGDDHASRSSISLP